MFNQLTNEQGRLGGFSPVVDSQEHHWHISKSLVKYFTISLILLLGLICLLIWNWYQAGFVRDETRIIQAKQVIEFLKNYQAQFATFPLSQSWQEFSSLTNSQGLNDQNSFFIYCPAHNSYLLAIQLERELQVYPQTNLASKVALNNCLTSTGVTVKSLQCSQAGVSGQVNGQTVNILCLGD